MTAFFIATDADDEPTLWTGDPDKPTAALRRCDIASQVRDQTWLLLMAACELSEDERVALATENVLRRAGVTA